MSFHSATTHLRSALHVRTLTSAVLALAVVASTHTEVRAAADERPDLKIELAGLPLSNATRDVQVRVSNVSAWWATGSRLRVETVSPTAGNVKDVDIGNLDPGQSVTLSYTLAAACNGDVVKAKVTGAKNYAGVAESQLDNNQLQTEVCTAQAPTKPVAATTTTRATDAVSSKPTTDAVSPKPTTDATSAGAATTAQTTDPIVRKPVDVSGAVVGQALDPGSTAPSAGLQIPRSSTVKEVDAPSVGALQIPRSTTAPEVDTRRAGLEIPKSTTAPEVDSRRAGLDIPRSTTANEVDGRRLGSGGSLATVYYPPNEQLEEFYVDNQGAINVVWKAQGGRWRPAAALTGPGFAPQGAPLAAVYQPVNERLDVFVVGVDGALRGIYKEHNGTWQVPVALTDVGLAPPGAHVAAEFYATYEQLEVFVVDQTGRVNVIWQARNGTWKPAEGLQQGFAAPGAQLTVVYQPLNEHLEVFAVAGDGAVHGIYKAQNSTWKTESMPAPAGFAPPAANIAGVFYPPNNQLELFVIDQSGTLKVIWKAQDGAWNPPMGLQSAFAAPGAPLAVAYQPLNEQLEVFAVAGDGSIHGIWKAKNSTWKAQFSLGSGGFAFARAPITATFYPAQNELAVITTDSSTSSKLAWKLNNGSWATCAVPLEFGTGTTLCDRGPTIAATTGPVAQAARCTALFRHFGKNNGWDFIYEQPALEGCIQTMGLEKACNDINAGVAVSYDQRYTGDPNNNRRALICSPRSSGDSFGDQFEHLVRGIRQGLTDAVVAAAPFFSMAVQGYACLDGVVFACATLALDVIDAAGADVPGVAHDVLAIARQAPDCVTGDIVACAQLGARGASAAGLSIPGIDPGQVLGDGKQCADGDFAACLRLGKTAADASGVPVGDFVGSAVQAEACADGKVAACAALGREVTQAAGVPLDELLGGVTNAHACLGDTMEACLKLGQTIASNNGVTGFPIDGTFDNIRDCQNGNVDACTALGKQAAAASGVPLGGIQDGVNNVRQCANGNQDACTALGRGVAIATGA
jgi:hypothetical protein